VGFATGAAPLAASGILVGILASYRPLGTPTLFTARYPVSFTRPIVAHIGSVGFLVKMDVDRPELPDPRPLETRLKLDEYAPRQPRRPDQLQQVLFLYTEVV